MTATGKWPLARDAWEAFSVICFVVSERMINLEIDIHSRDTNQDATEDGSGKNETLSSPEESEDGSAQTE